MTTRAQSTSTRRRAAVAAISGFMLIAAFAGSATAVDGNLPGGTAISVSIDAPADGTLVAEPPGAVTVTGTASVGEGVVLPDTTLTYVMDVSGSTDDGARPGCGGDQNADGTTNRVLDCQIAALRALNQEAITTGTVGEVGVIVFATSGAVGDVGPQAGEQALTGPATDADSAGGPDVDQVLTSAFSLFGGNGGLNLFTPKNVGVDTNFEAAVQNACALVQSTTKPNNIVTFVSDGTATMGASALDDLPCGPTEARFETFAVGDTSSCTDTGGGRGSLEQIAQATGGSCQHITDENIDDLVNILPGVIHSELNAVDISIDGSTFQPVDSTSLALPQAGPVSVTYNHAVSGLAPGLHDICVRASGSDAGGSGSVTDCNTITVADIALTPASETNKLGTPGQEHTVTGTVAAGSDGGVSGVGVDFEILSGPNAGETGSDTTDPNGEADFSYPATQGPGGLGTDTIQACFTDDLANRLCTQATKDWVDTTPPDPGCTASHNPAGNEPQAGNRSPGQNEDGFYELTAVDAVDPDPQIFLVDTGSGTVFGPFTNGTTVKYTQSPGATPSEKKIGGPNSQVQWHITGTGDAAVFAVDASGNESAQESCLVPPPPQ